MCGIIGLAGNTSNSSLKQEAWVNSMLLINQLRGKDGTGVVTVDEKTLAVDVYKRALSSSDFIQLNKTQQMVTKSQNYNILLGHNRAATKGAISDDASHPYVNDHITLIHNGTLHTYYNLCKKQPINDSDAISKGLAELKSSEDVVKFLETIDGAFALIWINSNNGTLNIARNKERPLSYMFNKNKDQIFFASEPWMITGVGTREKSNVDLLVKNNKFVLHDFSVNTLYTYDLANMDVTAPKRTTFVPYEPFDGYGWNSYHGHPPAGNRSAITTTKQTTKSKASKPIAVYDAYSNANVTRISDVATIKAMKASLKMSGFAPEVVYVPVTFDLYSDKSNFGRLTGYAIGYFGDNEKWVSFDTKDYVEVVQHGVLEDVGVDYVTRAGTEDLAIGALVTEVYAAKHAKGDTFWTRFAIDTRPEKYTIYEYAWEGAPEEREENKDEKKSEKILKMGPNSKYISLEEFKELIKGGCYSCGEDIPLSEDRELGWFEGGFPVCPTCFPALHAGYH